MALSKFLDVRNDVAFKKIFGTEKNKDILIHFLNDIIGFTGKNQIKDIEFLSTIQDPDIAAKKQSIVDVLCRDENGVQVIVEMQVAKTKGFEKRAQYYAAKAYSRQADKGDQYHNLKEIIFIAIADCVLFPNKSEYKSKHTIRDEDTNEHDLKDFYFIFIELPKFPNNKEDQLENIVEKWVYFFRYADETSEEELEKIIGSDVIIKKAYEELNRFNWSEKEFIAYEQEIKRILDEQAVLAQKLDDATGKGREEGKEEGIQIGHEKGRAEGIQIGAEKGEKQAKITVAKNLLKAGVSIDIIAQTTGLTVDEVKDLS
ncbi:Rpn family recombination-promoting nuclease/putative transposase [Wolbachia endosymbiont of Drosophila pseudotakahashii]|uniref:Rpn family recombination-promoting nuclease/putative transposase n=1 Tax=Wolbachia endosymbiont of Drosophila pseudotakahashii TaxID=375919 RepID=UPI00222EBA65|nr:Rpn family recombination-promoting nuclease/putative transposase [Wolbachia endosymbiont of Drosophila pseudotakahashii]MCX3064517.1 Rpn family recombination-promoting nuclease/putative transposase [Wolbachia endosymbiont of Drosophila pseudotakahashii]UZE37998.1 Rpn family recombination-promoting nuclease/putative transposase [Wolbachia endosymbiont of Drosophila pseudotakahashii]